MIDLHSHSTFSALDGRGTPEQVMERIKELGRKVVCITDHDNVYGHPFFQHLCKKDNNGIKPLFGVELRVVKDIRNNPRHKNHLTVIAKDNIGYQNLLRLVTSSYKEDCFYYLPSVGLKTLEECSEGLVVLSGCMTSMISEKILENDLVEAVKLAKWFKSVFGDRFYLELTAVDMDETDILAPAIKALSKKLSIPIVFTNDVHCLRKGEENIWKMLMSIKWREPIANMSNNPPSSCYYMEDDEAWQHAKNVFGSYFNDDELYTLFANQEKVASDCNVEIQKPGNINYGVDDSYSLLKERIKNGWIDRKLKGDNYKERVYKELDLIHRKGFSDYFLAIADIVSWAKKEGILVGPSRGSSACSLVAYTLGITEVDPLRYDLIMERFLSEDRTDLPDIDIDFEHTKRSMVIDHIIKKFGSDKVAQMTTLVRFKGRNSLAEIGKMYGIPRDRIETVQRMLVERGTADARASFTIEDTFSGFNAAKKIAEEYPEIMNAVYLEGQIRHMGVHAAGIVVSNKPLMESTALIEKKDESGRSINVASLDGSSITYLGLLKIDILALKELTQLREMAESAGLDPKIIYTLPQDDNGAIDIFNGNSLGVFQFGATGTASVARQLEIDSFNDVVLCNALSRPGPLHCLGAYSLIYDCDNSCLVAISNAKKHGIRRTLSLYPDGKIAPANVLGIEYTGWQPIYRLEVDGDRRILATDKHRFMLNDGSWMELKDLSIGDKIRISNEKSWDASQSLYPEKVKRVASGGFEFIDEREVTNIISLGKRPTYDMQIDVTHNYLADGFVVHNSGNSEMITRSKRDGVRKDWGDPLLNEITESTYGYSVFQEQVMRIMAEVGMMNYIDVAAIRNAMSKSYGDEFFNKYRDIFKNGAMKEWGFSDEFCDEIFDHVSTFGSWSFNKAHSVGYSLISYATAWFKHHYPREFYKVLCNYEDQKDEKIKALLREYIEHGHGDVLPPKINKSDYGWKVEGNNLRAGLFSVLPEGASREIASAYPILNEDDMYSKVSKRKVNSRARELVSQHKLFDNDDSYDPFGLYAFSERLGYVDARTEKIGDIGYNYDFREIVIAGVLDKPINLKSIQELKDTVKLKDWKRRFDESKGDEWAILYLRDESGVCNCHVKNDYYPDVKDMLWSLGVGEDIIVVKGLVPASMNYVIAKEITRWNDRKAVGAKCYKCTLINNKYCPPSGNENANVVLLGMCPGRVEIEEQRGFSGHAGEVLDDVISECGAYRKNFWASNATLCRPVDENDRNVDPSDHEVSCCHDRLMQELHMISPKVVIAFGKVAYKALSGESVSINEISGSRIDMNDFICVPTLHPASTLYGDDDGAKRKKIKDAVRYALELAGG